MNLFFHKNRYININNQIVFIFIIMNLKKIIFESILMEDNRRREVIRKIVKDLIIVFKDNVEGDFYLPEYFEDRNPIYEFPGLNENLTVEFKMSVNENIDNFIVNANYYGEEEIIEINLEYNPKNKRVMSYDLIGELNEIVAHEIRHVDQKNKNMFNIRKKNELDPYKYYLQPHEMDAQIFGFNRLSKLTRKPFEEIVRNWYKTHKDLHRLTDSQSENVINKLLIMKNKR